MDRETDGPRSIWANLQERSGVILGVVGLVAWLALLWFMFGDVL